MLLDRLYEVLWNTVCFVNLIVLAFNGWAFKKHQEVERHIMNHLLDVEDQRQQKKRTPGTQHD